MYTYIATVAAQMIVKVCIVLKCVFAVERGREVRQSMSIACGGGCVDDYDGV